MQFEKSLLSLGPPERPDYDFLGVQAGILIISLRKHYWESDSGALSRCSLRR